MTKRDLLTDAAVELGILDPGDTLGGREADTLGKKFDRLIDRWNAKRAAVYADRFDTFTLTPALSPHTIGATGGTWTMTQRPVSIEDAALVITGGADNVYRPIWVRDAAWYARQLTVPTLDTAYPTDVYYQPDWPLGKFYFWPIPTTAYQVRLRSRLILSALTIDQDFDLPPGYRDAITLTLTEECADAFGKQLSGLTVKSAAEARALIFANNAFTPIISTRDGGMARTGGRKTFNYLSREM